MLSCRVNCPLLKVLVTWNPFLYELSLCRGSGCDWPGTTSSQLLLPAVSGHSPTVLSRDRSSMCQWSWRKVCSMRAVPLEAKKAHCDQSVRRGYLHSPFGWSTLPSDCLPVLSSERRLHFLSGSQDAKEAPKYCSTLLNSNNNILWFHIIFSPAVSKCMTIANESTQRIPEIEYWGSYFSDADDEAEPGNVSVARINAVGLWQWQKC